MKISDTALAVRKLMYGMTAENALESLKKARALAEKARDDQDVAGYLEGMLNKAGAFGIDIG